MAELIGEPNVARGRDVLDILGAEQVSPGLGKDRGRAESRRIGRAFGQGKRRQALGTNRPGQAECCLRRTRDALFPGGSFQERGLGLIGALARHGRSLLAEVEERMDPFAQGHQVVYL